MPLNEDWQLTQEQQRPCDIFRNPRASLNLARWIARSVKGYGVQAGGNDSPHSRIGTKFALEFERQVVFSVEPLTLARAAKSEARTAPNGHLANLLKCAIALIAVHAGSPMQIPLTTNLAGFRAAVGWNLPHLAGEIESLFRETRRFARGFANRFLYGEFSHGG